MKNNSILKWVVIASIMLLILAIGHLIVVKKLTDIQFYQAFIDLVKLILIGFFLGALGLIIPQMLPLKEYEFKMKKEAYEKYSEAKTEIDHLPYSLQFISSPQDALKLLKDIHTKKHLAETYSKYLPKRNPEGENPSKKIWLKDYDPYKIIVICQNVVQNNLTGWEYLSATERFKLFPAEVLIKNAS